MSADELRRRVDHDVDPVFDWPKQQRRHHRVVTQGRQLMFVCDVGDLAKVGDVVLRIPDALEVHTAGIFIDEVMNLFGFVRVEEAHLDSHQLERLGKQRPCTAVEARRGDEILARVTNRQDRRRDCGLPRSQREPPRAAVHRRQALFEDVVRRVHDAAVDVPEFRQAEQVRSVFGAFEDVGRRRVDRHGARMRGRIGHLPCMDRHRSQPLLRFFTHRLLTSRLRRAGCSTRESSLRAPDHGL